MSKILVLSDGETFSNASGCMLIEAGDLNTDQIEERLDDFKHEIYEPTVDFQIIGKFNANGELKNLKDE